MNNIKLDNPISKSADDKLNRKNFAEHISNIMRQLCNIEDSSSIVFGLYGKWGDGKTSLINLIKENLLKNIKQEKENKLEKNINSNLNWVFKSFLILLVLSFHFFTFLETIEILESFFDNFGYLYYKFNFCIELFLKTIVIFFIILHKPFDFTWLINMFKKAYKKFNSLIKKRCETNNTNKLMIIDFAPWNLTNKESLIKDFFLTLRNVLKKDYCELEVEDVLDTFDEYVKCLCNKIINKKSPESCKDDILTLKTALEEKLNKLNKKIVIFIDDIDRLSDLEIITIFKLVKSLANLPNIIYFLSFDKQIVSEALNNYHNNKGEEFLEKIIQIPFELPMIEENRMANLFCDALQKFIDKFPEIDKKWEKYYKNYWQALVLYKFFDNFKNIRDIERYINALTINYNSTIHNEINFIDFIVIIAFQVFNNDLYLYIKNNRKFFTADLNERYNGLSDETKQLYREGLDKCLDNFGNEQKINLKNQVMMLFPNISIQSNIFSPIPYEARNNKRKNGRICCLEHFDTYFTLALSDEDITLTKISDLIELSQNTNDLAQKMLELNEKHKIKTFLERLEDYTKEDITKEQAINIIKTLFDVGDYFELSDDGFWSIDIYIHILRIIYQLLNNNLIENKFEVLKEAISNNRSLYPAINYVQTLISSLDKKDGGIEQDYVTQENIEILKKIITKNINKWKNNDLKNKDDILKPFNGHLIKHIKSNAILSYWYHNGNKTTLKAYVNKMTADIEGLLMFLSALKHKVRSSSGYGYNEYYQIYGEVLAYYFDLDKLMARVNELDKTKLSNNEQELVTMVFDAITKFKEEKNKENT